MDSAWPFIIIMRKEMGKKEWICCLGFISQTLNSQSDSLLSIRKFSGLILLLKDSLGKGSVTSISKEGRTFYYAFSPFPAVARANLSNIVANKMKKGAPTAYFLGAIPG